MVPVAVKVHIPILPDADRRRTLCPLLAGNRIACLRPGSFQLVGKRQEQVLGGFGLLGFVLGDHRVARAVLEDDPVDHLEAWVIEEFGGREGRKVARVDGVEPVVVFAGSRAGRIGELAFERGRPDDPEFLGRRIVEELRSPAIHDALRVCKRPDLALGSPLQQVLGTRVAKGVALPGGGPDHVECAIGTLQDRRVAHELIFADGWFE